MNRNRPNRAAEPGNISRLGRKAGARAPQSIGTELEHLHIRVIALENLVISLLSQAPERPRTLSREMASFISPRPGFTAHTRTLEAAAGMTHLLDRARHFQDWIEGDPLS